MSARPKRSSTATPQPQAPAQPGSTSTPVNVRPGSPLSPTRVSRLQEKAELQNLNDRLAAYIDRVRNLETENARLSYEMQSSRETVTRETSTMKSLYESELNDARRLLDETSREKAKLEIDLKRLWEQNDELKTKLDKKTKECSVAEGNARMYEARNADLQGKYNAANVDRKKAVDELVEAQKEIERLRKHFDDARKHLEDETLARVDLENCIQSLREELAFKDQIHTQEVTETRSRRQVDISEIDGRLSEQYEAKLQQSLQELRDQYESQMRNNREEIESLYETKIKNLEMAANRHSTTASHAIDELRLSRSRIDGLNGRINDLENGSAALNARIRELENTLDAERVRHSQEVVALDLELQRLRDEMAKQLQEYQDLMDIKVSLDMELAAYDKMLHGEETRLNMTPNVSNIATVSSLNQSYRRKTPARSPSAAGGAKRKRTVVDESEDVSNSEFFVASNSKGDIQISEVDGEGKFVKLFNKGSKEISVGGWQLVRIAGDLRTNFKFNRSVKIEPGGTVTVWSSDAGVAHEPPSNIVMKGQKWFVNDDMKTSLSNTDGVEEAVFERVKRMIITRVSRHRSTAGGLAGEELYRQQQAAGGLGGGSRERQGQEKCRIM